MQIKIRAFIIVILGLIILSSCGSQTSSSIAIDYTFETAINPSHDTADFDQIDFIENQNLDLGFFDGKAWIKLEINNQAEHTSYMVMTNDLINRNYRFYKLDTTKNSLVTVSKVDDTDYHDHRTFNNPKPNFEIHLYPNEKATFFITTESDGRILQATPQLLTTETYNADNHLNTLLNISFYAAVGMLLLINFFLWNTLKNKIYYLYGAYIFASSFFYLTVEGHLYGIGLSHGTVDHLMFLSIRIWIFSVIVFTAKFLDLAQTSPKFYNIIRWALITVLGGTTLYQLIFYNSSIAHLHMLENLFGFIWICIAIAMILISINKRPRQAKYYLMAFSFLIFFVVLGLIDSHTTILSGDPFSYFKIGTFIELCGFTYFIALIIKQNLKKSAILEKKLQDVSLELEQNEDRPQTNTTINKTDLLGIFKLLESTITSEVEWASFKEKFNELNPNFLFNLSQNHPNLTKSETRLLILINIGFTQKEIASILHIVPESVKKAKQRVRKKLALPSNIVLTEYLSELNNTQNK